MIAGLLLAAGESSRMGRLKALLPWRGKTLLETQVEALLAAGAGPIVVVLGHRADELRSVVPARADVRVTLNERYQQGRATSVVAGAHAAPPEAAAIVVASVDQPLDEDVLRRMIAAHDRTGAAVVIPSFEGRQGHPPLFDGRLLPELLQVTEAQGGLREIVTRHADEIEYLPVSTAIVRVNLNSPEDYAAALEHFGKAPG
ncbi:MAG: nucleotidyltransferase family protein [Chloroflexota bacterium]|nr:nucleotidyltransferase family protein [Chloroflexota bacterium]